MPDANKNDPGEDVELKEALKVQMTWWKKAVEEDAKLPLKDRKYKEYWKQWT